MQLLHLPDAVTHNLFPAFEEMLAPAVDDGSAVFDPAIDVMWLAVDDGIVWGAATTRLRTDGTAELRLAGGKRFREWMGPLDAAVTDWARACGSPALVMHGRRGWVRFAKRHGWAVQGTDSDNKSIFEKRLDREGK